MTLDELLTRHHSPSFLTKLKFCPRRHHVHYYKELSPASGLDYRMLWGRMYHRAVQAVDGAQDPRQALSDEGTQIRLDPTYLAKDSLLIDRASEEVLRDALPAYRRYLVGPLTALWETVELERKIQVEIEGLKLEAITDKVVRVDGKLWGVERKTTSRDDANWDRQWGLNFQTTLEAMVIEKHYEEPVQGIWLEQVVVTRKRKKNWPEGLPQEIHRVECKPPRPIDKSSPWVRREAVQFVRGCVEELRWRYRNGLENEPNYTNCGRCDLYEVCRGRTTAEQLLVPRKN